MDDYCMAVWLISWFSTHYKFILRLALSDAYVLPSLSQDFPPFGSVITNLFTEVTDYISPSLHLAAEQMLLCPFST
jgi:hypothetical protein